MKRKRSNKKIKKNKLMKIDSDDSIMKKWGYAKKIIISNKCFIILIFSYLPKIYRLFIAITIPKFFQTSYFQNDQEYELQKQYQLKNYQQRQKYYQQKMILRFTPWRVEENKNDDICCYSFEQCGLFSFVN